jgi:hypothetical protein
MIKEASRKIYNELINGKLINKQIYIDGLVQSNYLYEEILLDLEGYKKHYDLMGLQLTSCGDAFYLKEDEALRYKDTPALKIQALIFVISKHCMAVGARIECILDSRVGMNRGSIEKIGEIIEVQDILKACDMKNSLLLEIENNLVSRHIAFWNQADGLVYTNGGVTIFNQLFRSSN